MTGDVSPVRGEFDPILSEKLWLEVSRCPGCGGVNVKDLGELDIEQYRHGKEILALPDRTVHMHHCKKCDLFFKGIVPSPDLLKGFFSRQTGMVWTEGYDYADEVGLIRYLANCDTFDLLDIGVAEGGLLKALDLLDGRRSGLDLVAHRGIESAIRGEFIQGLVDEDILWGEEPYDIVTMFDLIEHLYYPEKAFANLRLLVKPGGYVVVETGNVGGLWPRRFGILNWWYAHLLEHHLFWTNRSLGDLAQRYGFRMVSFKEKYHKEHSTFVLKRDLGRTAKAALYCATPVGYRRVTKALGKSSRQPWSTLVPDHFRAVLQRDGG